MKKSALSRVEIKAELNLCILTCTKDQAHFIERKKSVLIKVIVKLRWSSMAGVAESRFFCCVYISF